MVLVSMIRKGRLATKRQREKGGERRGGIEGGGAGRQEGGGREEERKERRENKQPVSDTDINRGERRQRRKHAAEVGGATANKSLAFRWQRFFLFVLFHFQKRAAVAPARPRTCTRGCFLGSLAETYGHRGQCHADADEHRRGHSAPLVGEAEAGVGAVEAPLVRTDSGAVQNQAGQHR